MLYVVAGVGNINDLCRRHFCIVSRSSTCSVWSLYSPPTVLSECCAGVTQEWSKVELLHPARWLDCKNCSTPDCSAVRLNVLHNEPFRSLERLMAVKDKEGSVSSAEANRTVMQWLPPTGWHLHTLESKTRTALKGFQLTFFALG